MGGGSRERHALEPSESCASEGEDGYAESDAAESADRRKTERVDIWIRRCRGHCQLCSDWFQTSNVNENWLEVLDSENAEFSPVRESRCRELFGGVFIKMGL